jgi:transposase
MPAWIGIDVSKDTLDACLLREQGKPLHQQLKNEPTGFAKLLRWGQHHAPDTPLHFCLESTGAYSTALALYLAEAGQKVSVVNPFRVKHAAIGGGAGNKTDKADAKAIADYCRKEQPAPWRLATSEARTLLALMRRLGSLQEHLTQEEGRLLEPSLIAPVEQSLQQTIAFLQAEILRVREQIEEHVQKHPLLAEDKALLTSIPGIGDLTALWIMAELPDVRQFASAQSAAAYAGLNPRQYQSGTSVKKPTRLSKAGNGRLRRALYMPALSAYRFNPVLKDLFERLRKRGLCKKAALCAVMRKLLMLAYGVLKTRQKFTLQAVENPA